MTSLAESLRAGRGLPLALLVVVLLGGPAEFRPAAEAAEGEGRLEGGVHVGSLPPPPPETGALARSPIRFRHPDLGALQREKARLQPDESARVPGPEDGAPASPLAPSVGIGFAGLRLSDPFGPGFVPPDTQVAAGPNHVFEVVNAKGRIFTKVGGIVRSFTLQQLFGLPASADLFDPRIRFDLLSGRWFVVAASREAANGRVRFAVSQTSDPTGVFFVYSIAFGGGLSIPDFPAIGFSNDKVVITANAFACQGGAAGCTDFLEPEVFLGTEFVVLRKADLLAGLALSCSPSGNCTLFNANQGFFTIQPAHSLSPITTLFMASALPSPPPFPPTTSTLRIWSVTGVPGIAPGVQVTTVDRFPRLISVPPDAVQLGSPSLIETNDNRLLDAVYRDGSLWVSANTACIPPGDVTTRACMRFIRVLTAGLTINQDFDFGRSTFYFYFPAIQLDLQSNLLAVFSGSSPNEFPAVWATGRLTTDPPGTLQTPPVRLKTGERAYTDDRWGDYSGAGVDPVDQTAVWVAGEYARLESPTEWGTWIARIRLVPPVFTGGAFVTAGNLDGLGLVEIVTGADGGSLPRVRTFPATGGAPLLDFDAYPAGFAGGVRVAVCDVTGDLRGDIITAPGPGTGPLIRGFDGVTGALLGQFFAAVATYVGGAFVACGDLTGDGLAEVMLAADTGVGPVVVVWRVNGGPLALLTTFFAYDPAFLGGVRLAACDVNGDGRVDIITAPGPGGAPHIRVFDGVTFLPISEFFAYPLTLTTGVYVACGDVVGTAGPEIVTAPGPGGGPLVRVFDPLTGVLLNEFFAYGATFLGGVRVAVGNLAGAAPGEILTVTGPGVPANVRGFTAAGAPTGTDFQAY